MVKFNKLFEMESSKYKIYKILYTILFIVTVLIGLYTSNEPKNAISVAEMPLYGILLIFINNLFLAVVWLLYSTFGMSIFFIVKFLVHFGQVGIESGINPMLYYFISLPHGIGELFVTFIIFVFTIEQFITWFNFYKHRDFKKLEDFYKYFFKHTFLIIVFILLISACLEVLVSNKLINIILK